MLPGLSEDNLCAIRYIKDAVNHKVLAAVGCSFFAFFIISTRLMQNIVAKIGITYRLMTKKTHINKLFIPFNKYTIFLHAIIFTNARLGALLAKIQRHSLIEVTPLVKERFSNNYSMSAQVVRSENTRVDLPFNVSRSL